MRSAQRLFLAAIITSMAWGMGCSKVTSDNFEKIEIGMTSAQVEDILGKGSDESGGAVAIGNLNASAKTVLWESGDQSITVTFANDKVVMKTKKGF